MNEIPKQRNSKVDESSYTEDLTITDYYPGYELMFTPIVTLFAITIIFTLFKKDVKNNGLNNPVLKRLFFQNISNQ